MIASSLSIVLTNRTTGAAQVFLLDGHGAFVPVDDITRPFNRHCGDGEELHAAIDAYLDAMKRGDVA